MPWPKVSSTTLQLLRPRLQARIVAIALVAVAACAIVVVDAQTPSIMAGSSTSASVSLQSTATTATDAPSISARGKSALFGIYDFQDSDFNQSLGLLQDMQSFQGGKNFGVVHFFTEWCQALSAENTYYDTIVFQQKLPSIWNQMNAVPLITWQPACFNPKSPSPESFVTEIANGKHDAFIDAWARNLQAFVNGYDGVSGTLDDRRVYIRLGHEMNSNFYQWAPGKGVVSVKDYISFWRRTRSRFDMLGFLPSQLQWIWCPNNFDSGGIKAEDLYPGDDAADWLGFDAYNGAGVFNDGAGWASAANVMDPIVGRLVAISRSKPIAACEIGTVLKDPSPGMDGKVAWLRDFYDRVVHTYNVSLVAYFNVDVWAVHGWGQPDVPAWSEIVNNASVGLVSASSAAMARISDAQFYGRGAGDLRQATGGQGPVKNPPASSSSSSSSARMTRSFFAILAQAASTVLLASI